MPTLSEDREMTVFLLSIDREKTLRISGFLTIAVPNEGRPLVSPM